MIRIAVIGATGYTGIELLRQLERHPQVKVTCLFGDSSAGQEITSVYPHLSGFYSSTMETFDVDRIAELADAVFIALPSGHVGDYLPALLKRGLRVIDLGGDLRLPADTYAHWYKKTPVAVEHQQQAVYGLAEWYADDIRHSQLVANPGCYPTATLLALLPLLAANAIDPETVLVDAKSGVSGAGKALSAASLFSEINENFKAYKVNQHQHTPEIEQQLARVANHPVTITFTPHLVPMTRGIMATVYAKAAEGWSEAKLLELFQNRYASSPFVRMRPVGNYPQTKEVYGSNFCDIGLSLDSRTGRVTVISVIDNLVKGAAGQAVQNLNIMFGLEETLGLLAVPSYP